MIVLGLIEMGLAIMFIDLIEDHITNVYKLTITHSDELINNEE